MRQTVIKPSKNTGIALPIILILLLVMTILGVTSLSNSSLQERMTSAERLRSYAFLMAETTLREAEAHAATNAAAIRTELFANEEDEDANPHWVLGFPSNSESNPGNFCTNGYCIPFEFDNRLATETQATTERWLDANVWANARDLQAYTAAELAAQNIIETPTYIIELLGQVPHSENGLGVSVDGRDQIRTKCTVKNAPNNGYPFCRLDPYFFRITARATAGLENRQSTVMLQSTVFVDPAI